MSRERSIVDTQSTMIAPKWRFSVPRPSLTFLVGTKDAALLGWNTVDSSRMFVATNWFRRNEIISFLLNQFVAISFLLNQGHPTGAEAAATGAAATGHFIYDLEAVRLAATGAAAAATGAAATCPFVSPEPIRLFPPSRRNLISLNQFMSPEPVRARPEPID